MHWAVECALLGIAALGLMVPTLFPPSTRVHHTQAPRENPCNIRALDARGFSASRLAAQLSTSAEPVLVRGFAPENFWPCESVDSCLEACGEMTVGVSTGGAIGSQNPERALEQARNGRLEMTVNEYTAAMRRSSLPTDSYVFASTKGSDLERRFSPLRTIFAQLLDNQQPELKSLRITAPELAERVSNVSMRFALGGLATGSSWHAHGPALLAVLDGRKSWFIRDNRTLPTWLEETWPATERQSTQAWLRAAMSVSPTSKDAWLQHIWHCSQSARELMFVPETLRHAIHNEDETLAISVQVDMLAKGSPLHAAAVHGSDEETRSLLEAGANVNVMAEHGTALHYAAFLGHEVIVRLLLEAGAKRGALDERGETALDVATTQGESVVVRLLTPSGRKAKRKQESRGSIKGEI